MELVTRCHRRGQGWSEPLPDLDSERTLVLAFAGAGHAEPPTPLRELAERYPTSALIGCSTAGEIFGTNVEDDTLVAAICRFERSHIRRVAVDVPSMAESRRAGEAIGGALAGAGLRSVLVLSDGLGVNGSELVRGLDETLGADVSVAGGLAADGDRFEKTWVYDGESARHRRVVAVGLFGDRLVVGHGSRGGWDRFGPERLITRSRGNVLYEVDGRPALDLYRDYLGARAEGLPATALLFPLALRAGRDDGDGVVRTILSVDDVERSLTFAGDVPEGALAQLMRANFDRLVDGAAAAAAAARPTIASDVLAIAISCVGRRLVLGERTEEETEATLQALSPKTHQIGFYSYGEIAPRAESRVELHNQTMTLTTIAERDG